MLDHMLNIFRLILIFLCHLESPVEVVPPLNTFQLEFILWHSISFILKRFIYLLLLFLPCKSLVLLYFLSLGLVCCLYPYKYALEKCKFRIGFAI